MIEHQGQQCPIDAVVTNKDDGLILMPRQHAPQRIAGSRSEILKRFSVRKAEQLRGRVPSVVLLGKCTSNFVVRFPPPFTVIEVVEQLENPVRCAAGHRNGRAGRDATAHRARVDCRWLRHCRDPLSGRPGRCDAQLAERDVCAAPETGRVDAFDVAMARQNNLCRHGRRSFTHLPRRSRRAVAGHHCLTANRRSRRRRLCPANPLLNVVQSESSGMMRANGRYVLRAPGHRAGQSRPGPPQARHRTR